MCIWDKVRGSFDFCSLTRRLSRVDQLLLRSKVLFFSLKDRDGEFRFLMSFEPASVCGDWINKARDWLTDCRLAMCWAYACGDAGWLNCLEMKVKATAPSTHIYTDTRASFELIFDKSRKKLVTLWLLLHQSSFFYFFSERKADAPRMQLKS